MTASLRLAWRNLWRNRRRTWLTVGAMIFSNILLIFMISLQLGGYDMMIENTLKAFTGHMQVQRPGYKDDPKLRNSIPDVVSLADSLRRELGSSAVAARGIAFALASSEQRSFGIQVTGVEPAFEPQVSMVPGLVRKGRYLKDNESAEIVIGSVLARNLKIGIGDELTLLGSGRDGSFAAAVLIVSGIFETGMPELDRNVAQMPLGYFQSVFAMEGQGHSIVVDAPALELVPQWQQRVEALLPDGDLLVLDWDALLPGLQQAIRADMTGAWFTYSVLIVLVSFSVLNTQLMSVLERTREFGVMLALGLRPARLGSLVVLETALMALLGLAIGVLLGYVLTLYLAQVGVYFEGMDELNEKFNMPGRMYPTITLLSMFWGPAVVFIGAVMATIYPALRLLRLRPVEAMRAV